MLRKIKLTFLSGYDFHTYFVYRNTSGNKVEELLTDPKMCFRLLEGKFVLPIMRLTLLPT